ncbi:MAG: glycosyltransferase [Ignavibacteria bacterium]|nr:glycosyltransferase [Ignavibacteria bacterium]
MILIFFTALVIISANLLLIFFLIKEDKKCESNDNYLCFSIIIAARNEIKNLPGLLDSLCRLDYTEKKYEIIISDDNSDDGSLEWLTAQTKYRNNIKAVSAKEKTLPGKKGALEIGVTNAKFENILITDADCRPEPDWLSAFNRKFSEGFDLVFSAAPFFSQNSFVNKIARFENLRSIILTFALCNANLPYSAAARSFGYTKSLYNNINGYKNTTDTLSGDDDLFIREAVKAGARIGCFAEKGSMVFSETKSTFKDYFNQKARHTSTSNYYLLKHKIILGSWHLLNLSSFIFLCAALFYPFALAVPAVKFFADILLCSAIQKKFSYNFKFPDILGFQIIYELNLITNYIFSFLKKKSW